MDGVKLQVKLLRAISPVTPDAVVLGQYTAAPDGSVPGYVEAGGGGAPTFATMVLYVDNPRWQVRFTGRSVL